MRRAGKDYAAFEEFERQKLTGSMVRRILPFFAPYKGRILLCGLLLLASSLLSLAGPLLLRRAIDRDIPSGDGAGLAVTLGLYIASHLSIHALGFLHAVVIAAVGQRIMAGLKLRLFDRLMAVSMEFYDRTPVGRVLSRVENDVETLSTLFTQTILALAGNGVMFAGMVIVVFTVDWRLALVVFTILPVMVAIAFLYSRFSPPLFLAVRRRYADVTSFVAECVQGMRSLQLSNADGYARRRMEDEADGYRAVQWRAELAVIFFWNSIALFEIVGLALVLWYGGGRALQGAMTLGTLVLFIGYIKQLFGPIRALSDQLNVIQKAGASARRIFDLLDTPVRVADPADPAPWPAFEETLEFRDVTFSYDGRRDVLSNVSFTVRRGERVAVLGLTGAGKSTLANLICRFYDPTGGAVLVDGRDLKSLAQKDLRDKIGLVLQDVFLFPGDVAGNVLLGRADVPRETLEAACRAARAHDFIETLPQGYGTELSERGQNLSSGQRQLLAFARALVKDPPLLVLDEATSAVDGRTEALVQEALGVLLEGRTSVIIAHRLSTILDADRILVLHEGRLAESGTHASLMAAGGLYEKFFRLQFGSGRAGRGRAAAVPAGGA